MLLPSGVQGIGEDQVAWDSTIFCKPDKPEAKDDKARQIFLRTSVVMLKLCGMKIFAIMAAIQLLIDNARFSTEALRGHDRNRQIRFCASKIASVGRVYRLGMIRLALKLDGAQSTHVPLAGFAPNESRLRSWLARRNPPTALQSQALHRAGP